MLQFRQSDFVYFAHFQSTPRHIWFLLLALPYQDNECAAVCVAVVAPANFLARFLVYGRYVFCFLCLCFFFGLIKPAAEHF